VTTDFASIAGWRNVTGETIEPNRMRSVTAPRAEIVAHASSAPRSLGLQNDK
jgi:hypothetical protein